MKRNPDFIVGEIHTDKITDEEYVISKHIEEI